MDTIEKRINNVMNIIINYFYDNNIYKSSCLAQSYILYKYILKLTHNNNTIPPTLIKGYIINHITKDYYGHFWVEYNNKIYDISTYTYLLDYEIKYHDEIKNTMRILVKNIPNDILTTYENIDFPFFDMIRDKNYNMCIENNFLKDVKENVSLEHYKKIKIIYKKIMKK